MTRRGLFAALITPLVARFTPKAKPRTEAVTVEEQWNDQGKRWFVNGQQVFSEYWHGQPPFVVLEKSNYPWVYDVRMQGGIKSRAL